MALLFMDGFGHNDTAAKWHISSSVYTLQTASARTPGGRYGRFTNNGSALRKDFAASSQVFVGFGLSTNNTVFLTFYGDSASTPHITLIRNSSTGRLEIRRGASGGTLLATGNTTLLNSQWNYIEVSATISDTIGEVHVRLNGQTVDDVSYVGDTKNAGTNTTIDSIICMNLNNAVTDIADFYILNSNGPTPNNNFLGDIVVRTLTLNGNGNYSQLTGSDTNQVDNYLLVDELPFSSTDYTGSAVAGNKDTYALSDLPTNAVNVLGVQLNGMMAKSDASLGSARYMLRTSNTDYMGTTRALTTTYTGYYELFENNPISGTSWTLSDVNNLEVGMEVA